MEKSIKKTKAFTLAEVMMTLLVVAVVATMLIKVVQRVYYKTLYRQMSYAAYMTLHKGIGEIIANSSTHNIGNDSAFCTKMSQNLNLVGAVNCDSTTTDDTTINNGTATPIFTTASGLIFYVNGTLGAGVPRIQVYVDLNGSSGNHKINDDVIAFIVNYDGVILPVVDNAVGEESKNTKYHYSYITADVSYVDASGVKHYVLRHAPWHQAVCNVLTSTDISNYLMPSTYCTGITIPTVCQNNICTVDINKP